MARSLFTKDECYLLAQVLALLVSSNYLSILPYRAKNISSRKEEFHEKFKHHYPYKGFTTIIGFLGLFFYSCRKEFFFQIDSMEPDK